MEFNSGFKGLKVYKYKVKEFKIQAKSYTKCTTYRARYHR